MTSIPRPRLPRALAVNVLPAYLIPCGISFANAQLIPNEQLSDRIAHASYTWIAIPSALASAVVTVWCHYRTPPPRPSRARVWRTFAMAALASAVLAAAVTAGLVGNGLAEFSVAQFTVSSAAIGGGLAARAWVRTHLSSRHPRHPRRTGAHGARHAGARPDDDLAPADLDSSPSAVGRLSTTA